MCPFLTDFWLLKTFVNVKVYHRCGSKAESTPANFFIPRLCDEKEHCCSPLIKSPNEWTPWHFLKNDLSEPERKWFSAGAGCCLSRGEVLICSLSGDRCF